jgi:hypothetical protein
LFLLFHFALVSIYAFPRTGEKTRIHYWAEYYVYPYFLQNWSLFAPPPTENYKLFVEYNDGESERKQEVLFELLSLHRENRFSGYEAVVLSLCNSIHYFEKGTHDISSLNGPVQEDLNFSILEHQINRYLNWKYDCKVSGLKIMLFTSNTQNGNKRVYYNAACLKKQDAKNSSLTKTTS